MLVETRLTIASLRKDGLNCQCGGDLVSELMAQRWRLYSEGGLREGVDELWPMLEAATKQHEARANQGSSQVLLNWPLTLGISLMAVIFLSFSLYGS